VKLVTLFEDGCFVKMHDNIRIVANISAVIVVSGLVAVGLIAKLSSMSVSAMTMQQNNQMSENIARDTSKYLLLQPKTYTV
jgi:hypothetical protein